MLKDSDFITVVCPNCQHEFFKEVGWLKNNVAFHCGFCQHRLKHNPRELLRLVNAESADTVGKFILSSE